MKHLKRLHHLTKKAVQQTLNLVKHEIFAVLAVAALCLIATIAYNYKTIYPRTITPTSPSTGGNYNFNQGLLPNWLSMDGAMDINLNPADASEALLATSTLGDMILSDLSTLNFGSTIKGHDRPGVETWAVDTGIQNQGTYLQVKQDNTVTIENILNGNHNLWIKGKGILTINNTTLTFKTLSVINKVIGVTSNTFVIKMKAGAQIHYISTFSPATDIPAASEEAATPTKIIMIPNRSTITLNSQGTAAFKPIVIATDQTGKQISHIANLLQWSSSDSNIATIGASGIVTARKTGTVTITTTITGTQLTATTVLTIKPYQLSPLVDITPTQGVSTAAESPAPTNIKSNPISDFLTSLFGR